MANAASGIAIHDDCKLRFLELKSKRDYRYIVFKIDGAQQQISVEKLGDPTESFENFTACLPENDCRYAVYDYDYVTDDNCHKSKIFFISWSPDTSHVRSKMLYSSSKERFKGELEITYEIQATDPTEIDIEKLKERT